MDNRDGDDTNAESLPINQFGAKVPAARGVGPAAPPMPVVGGTGMKSGIRSMGLSA
jgi:hypothetical protein